MTEDTAQSKPTSSLFTLHSSLSLEEARALVSSPLWPRIRSFLWDFASLCDPARLAATLALPEAGSPSPESAADHAAAGSPSPESAAERAATGSPSPESAAVRAAAGSPSPESAAVRAVAGSPSPESAAERAVAGSPSPESAAVRAVAGHTWPASWPAPPRLSRAAERALGLTIVFHSFPAEDASRLLLLSREDYDRLAQFLGVIALAPALRRVTLGAEVRALKSAIPDYREALSFAAYFHRFEALFRPFAPADGAATPAAVRSAGHAILAAALSTLPPGLLLRQRLRFPEGSPADTALQAAQASPDGQAPPCPTRTTSESRSSLAGEARAAALLALKLFHPQEYKTCFS